MGLLHHDDKDKPSQPTMVDGAGNAQVVGGTGGARDKMDEIKAREQQSKMNEKLNKEDKKEAKHEAKEERKALEKELKEAKKEEKHAKKL